MLKYYNFPLMFIVGIVLVVIGVIGDIVTLILIVLGFLEFTTLIYSIGVMILGLILMLISYFIENKEFESAVNRVDSHRIVGLRQLKEKVRGDEL
jgi:Zn-dependent membrane protease YugP